MIKNYTLINRTLLVSLSFLIANTVFAADCIQIPLNVSSAASDGGYSYIIYGTSGITSDNSNFNTQSTLRLFENGSEIGPAHSRHDLIRNQGIGMFSHWSLTDGTGESLRFSASDNTDPRSNGKNYSYCLTSNDGAQAPTVSTKPASTTTSPASLTPIRDDTSSIVGDTISLVTDPHAVFTEPALQRPYYLSPIVEPTFGTKVTRIAGDIGTSINFSQGGADTWSAYARHNYSKNQPWNADQSLLLIDNSNRRIYLDGNTYQPKFTDGANHYSRGDDRWHPKLPNIRVNNYQSLLEWFDVVNGTQVRNWPLPITPDWGIGSGEGNTSSDGRYVALANATSMFIVDMDPQAPLASYDSGNKRIGPLLDISDGGEIDWVSVSPSGKYGVVMYKPTKLRVFDIDPTTLALKPRPLPAGSNPCSAANPSQGYTTPIGHADMTMNPFDNNEDVIIGQKQAGCPVGVSSVMLLRLKDNAVASLTTGSTATMAHISARNLNRPGWVYVSYYNPANYQWDTAGLRYDDELVALKIDGSGSIERLAHTHTLSLNDYKAQAHVVSSPDGKRALWASNWSLYGNGSLSDIKPYVVDTRP